MRKFKFSSGLFVIALNAFLIFTSCKKDNPYAINITNGALIVNEGNYLKSNASVSYLNFADNSIVNNIFTLVNNRSLGDVLQSICIDNTNAYLVVNS
jgi:hypothetical protein